MYAGACYLFNDVYTWKKFVITNKVLEKGQKP